MQIVRIPPWLRMLEIILGSISLLLAIIILFIPGGAIETTILLLSLIFLVLGIERISFGIASASRSKVNRIANISLGVFVIGLSIFLMEFPVFSTALLIIICAVALLGVGIARIIHGIKADDDVGASQKILKVSIGILCVVASILIIANPTTFGILILVLILSMSLIIVGISMIVKGIRPEDIIVRKT
jgi:uncharacterized membrane protein HdeD (DUF308 family)